MAGQRIYAREARWYDAIYTARGRDVDGEIGHLAGVIDAAGVRLRSLLDVACGTGVHLERWRDRGVDVVGCDVSPDMLDVARTRLPDVELVECDMRELDLDRSFDVVTCLFSAIGHVADGTSLDAAVAAMARHVAPGGLLLIEPWLTPDRVEPGGKRDVVGAKDDEGAIARVSRSWREGDDLVVEFGWGVATRDGIEFDREMVRLPLVSPERYQQSVRRAGLVASWQEAEGFGAGRGLLIGRRAA